MKNYTHHIVYCTTCSVTKKWYIGIHSTNDLNDGYLGSGKILKHSISKYGKDAHKRDILFICEDRESAKRLESTMVNNTVLKLPRCMNIVEGGYTNNFGDTPWNKGLSKENTPKLSNAGRKKGSTPWNKGTKSPYSEDSIRKMVNNRKIYPKLKPKYKYITPDGTFFKRNEVAEYYGITPQAVSYRIKSETYPKYKQEKI